MKWTKITMAKAFQHAAGRAMDVNQKDVPMMSGCDESVRFIDGTVVSHMYQREVGTEYTPDTEDDSFWLGVPKP